MTKKYGIAAERQLVNLFWEHNFAAIRIPASGAGGKNYPKPDLIAGNGQKYYAFELKTSTSAERIYLHNSEVQELSSFSERFGCIPYIAVKFPQKSREWKFYKIPDLPKTSSGNYKIDFTEDFSNGIEFSQLL
ncbi:MAG TPA: Holliday junction resolvase Hjc [Candidatus Deferrimicrobium sp.]|nr:Holliday junction resolvase Hjc [Candidatus Deferrimicrobium sp.]